MTTSPRTAAALSPYLTYDDAPKAIEFLCRAFGFQETMRYPMPDGRIGHAELTFGDSVLMLASEYEGFGLVSPRSLPALHAAVFCRVDDLDAHYARAREGGATIIGEPAVDHGQRMYRALDPEGHRWLFAEELLP